MKTLHMTKNCVLNSISSRFGAYIIHSLNSYIESLKKLNKVKCMEVNMFYYISFHKNV